jgi:hypothetical protein
VRRIVLAEDERTMGHEAERNGRTAPRPTRRSTEHAEPASTPREEEGMTERPEAYRYRLFMVRRNGDIWRAYEPFGALVWMNERSTFSSAEEAEAAVDHYIATEVLG